MNQRNRPANDRDDILSVLSILLKDLDSSLENHFKACGENQDSNLNAILSDKKI